jgi:putative chitinase
MFLWNTIAEKINRAIQQAHSAGGGGNVAFSGMPGINLTPPPPGMPGSPLGADALSDPARQATANPAAKLQQANEAAMSSPYSESTPSESSSAPQCPSQEEPKTDCCARVTTQELSSIFTLANPLTISELAATFNESFDKFMVDSCLRKAHFFAQVLEEVGSSAAVRAESLNYTPTRLIEVFGYFKRNREEAQQYGRTVDHIADEEAIANRAYANRMGNGDVSSGDGWKFRGKGYLQLTGKSNYEVIQQEIDARYPGSGVNIIENEADILTVRGAMISAMAFWSKNGIYSAADGGDTDEVVDSVTAIINKATDSYDNRRANFGVTTAALNIAACAHKNEGQCAPVEKPVTE